MNAIRRQIVSIQALLANSAGQAIPIAMVAMVLTTVLQPAMAQQAQPTDLAPLTSLSSSSLDPAQSQDAPGIRTLAEQSPEQWFAMASQAYRDKQYPEALALLEQVEHQAMQQLQPVPDNVLYYLAITHVQLGNWAQAKSYYQAVMMQSPGSSAAQQAKAGLGILEKRFYPENLTTLRPSVAMPAEAADITQPLATQPSYQSVTVKKPAPMAAPTKSPAKPKGTIAPVPLGAARLPGVNPYETFVMQQPTTAASTSPSGLPAGMSPQDYAAYMQLMAGQGTEGLGAPQAYDPAAQMMQGMQPGMQPGATAGMPTGMSPEMAAMMMSMGGMTGTPAPWGMPNNGMNASMNSAMNPMLMQMMMGGGMGGMGDMSGGLGGF